MFTPPGGYRIIVPTYLYSLVSPIYPTPVMTHVAILDRYEFANLTGEAVARKYGRSYFVDARRHHVLSAWVLTKHGVEQGEQTELHEHRGSAVGDTTVENVSLGGECVDCAAVLASVPEFDRSTVGL